MTASAPNRRDLLVAPLLAAAAASLGLGPAAAAGVDPTMTMVTPPDHIPWKPVKDMPPEATAQADLFGATDRAGQYFVLVRWQPGFMSAPHFYRTDRLCVVLSGTWHVASGTTFDPLATVPVGPGSFVRRVAGTAHYDGVPRDAHEPAVIAISGIGPVDMHLVDPGKPLWRAV